MEQRNEFQNELFDDLAKPQRPRRIPRHKPVAKRYSILLDVTHEQAVFFVIALIIAGVIIFSLGVERGKRAAAPAPEIALELQEEVYEEAPESAEEVFEEIVTIETPKEEIPPAPPEPVQKVSRPYTIQVATYWSKPSAKREMERIRRRGMDSFIISTNGKYDVCVGEFITKDNADETITKLKNDYK